MTTPFPSWDSFRKFSRAVRYSARFLHDEGVTKFLKAIADSTEKRCHALQAEKYLWRAQLGHEWEERSRHGATYEEPSPFSASRMKPLRTSAHEGRVNPRGIPCLYAANTIETAITEVRPWLGALISVAQMRVVRELRLVKCGDGHDTNFDFCVEEPPPEEREKIVWREIGRAYSSPAILDPGVAEYVPTQVLSEHFRKQGYDGVVYKSKLGTGLNFALFDLDALEIVDLRLYPVKAVRYEIGDLQQDSYVVMRRKPEA